MGVVTAKEIGSALAKARSIAGMLQEQAAAALGVSRVAISNYERGMLPVDFASEKLPRLAALYGTTPEDIQARAEQETTYRSTVRGFNSSEPLDRHIHWFPGSVQSWYYAFMAELLGLSESGETESESIELARSQLTFDALQLWAGGSLSMSEPERCLEALQWCAESAWRNVTEPGWLSKSPDQWRRLPPPFVGRSRSSNDRERSGQTKRSQSR